MKSLIVFCLLFSFAASAQLPTWFAGNRRHVQHHITMRYGGGDSTLAIYDSVAKQWIIPDTINAILALIDERDYYREEARRLKAMVYTYAFRQIGASPIDTTITDLTPVLSKNDVLEFEYYIKSEYQPGPPPVYFQDFMVFMNQRYNDRKRGLLYRKRKGMPSL